MYRIIENRSKEVGSAAIGIDVAPISDKDAATLYGDTDIEALASGLYTLHCQLYEDRNSFSQVGTPPFVKLDAVLTDLDRPAARFQPLYGGWRGLPSF